MKFSFALLPIVAALGFVQGSPFAAEGVTTLAPVPVTKLVCDGNSYQCTASLQWGDGNWVAQWSTSVFHQGLFGQFTGERMTITAPVPVTSLVCDGNTYTCTAKLNFGDGNWVAQWNTAVFHQGMFSQGNVGTMAPVPVKSLVCDGDSYQCTAGLVWGDGNWVAQWSTAVFHQGL